MSDVREPRHARVVHAQVTSPKEAQTTLEKANRLTKGGDHEHARLAYELASRLFGDLRDRLGQGHTLLALGNLELAQRRTAEARTAYTRAGALYRDKMNRLGQAHALLGIGHSDRAEGNVNKARGAYEHAHKLYLLEQHDQGQAHTFLGMGHIDRVRGLRDQAHDYFLKALTLYTESDGFLGRSDCFFGLGLLYADNNPAVAARYYAQAADQYRALGLDDLASRASGRSLRLLDRAQTTLATKPHPRAGQNE